MKCNHSVAEAVYPGLDKNEAELMLKKNSVLKSKCENCSHEISKYCMGMHNYGLNLCCECNKPLSGNKKPESNCKHLEDYNVIANVINEADGSISLCVCNDDGSHYTAIINIRFCPFCGDELK